MNPLYFIEHQSPRIRGPWFLELDRDSNSRADVIDQIRKKAIDPVSILEVIEPCEDFPRGSCRNVTEELLCEANDVLPPSNIHPVSVRGLETMTTVR